MKSLLTNLPEIFFIGLGGAWFIENLYSGNHVNYIALLIIWLLFLQLIYKNRLTGIIYGNLLGVFSLYMLGAVYSEFTAFETINANAIMLLAVGGGIFGVGIFMAGRMLYNYLTTDKSCADNEFTISFKI